jgi:hypothetical protein
LHRRADCPFRCIIGGPNTLYKEKNEEVVPVFEKTSGLCTDESVFAILVMTTATLHPGANEMRRIEELLATESDPHKGMPTSEDSSRLTEHLAGEGIGVGTAAGVLDSLELSDEVSPTELTNSVMIFTISRIVVGDENSPENASENSRKHCCSTGGGDMEVYGQGPDKNP